MKIGDRVFIQEYLSVNEDYPDFYDFYYKNRGIETVITDIVDGQFKLKIDNGKYFWWEDELGSVKDREESRIIWNPISTQSNKNNVQNDFDNLLDLLILHLALVITY